MSRNEDSGGGGFKFKKRERKHRIKTASDRPEEEEEEQPAPQAAISTTETVQQPQPPSGPPLEPEPEPTGLNAAQDEKVEEKEEEKGEEEKGETAEANVEEAKVEEGQKEAEKEEEKENITEGPEPIQNVTMGATANQPTATPFGPSDGKPIRVGASPKKAPKFKQRRTKEFKSKPPKKGVLGFGDDIPGMDGLGTDITVICPWEAFSHLELHELAQFGII